MNDTTDTDPDLDVKLDRLRDVLESREVDEIWLATSSNFAWLLGGENLVNRSSEPGIAAVGFDGDRVTVLTTNIEATRLAAEEVPTTVALHDFDWFEQSLQEAIQDHASGEAIADIDVAGAKMLSAPTFRLPLTRADRERFRSLGSDVARALETACRQIHPDDTERDVAAAVQYELALAAIDAPVVLVGGESRAPRYRHFTPTDTPIGGYGIVSVSARRGGPWISATRTVAFDPPSWLSSHHAAATRVDASAIAASRAFSGSGTAGDVFAAIDHAYRQVGFEGEWRHHHQGGAAGFAAREWVATPDHPRRIESPCTFSWNPTVQGAKSEDTVLLHDDQIEVISQTGEWPTSEVRAIGFDDVIVRHDVLDLS